MTRLHKTKREQILEFKIEQLKIKQASINLTIQNITKHLSGEGYRRRIKPCDVDDPDDKECPWPLE